MLESVIERAFVQAVKDAGGMALKFTSQTMNGVPDRLVLFESGKCCFVELKAPGKQMRPLQQKRRAQLQALGFPVICVDNIKQIRPVVEALKQWNPGDPIPKRIGARIPELPTRLLPADMRGIPTDEALLYLAEDELDDIEKKMAKENEDMKHLISDIFSIPKDELDRLDSDDLFLSEDSDPAADQKEDESP